MLDTGDTIKVAPVPAGVPPHEPLYQRHVAPADNGPFTCKVELFPEHIVDVPVAETGLLGVVVTVTAVLTHAEKQFPF